MLCLFEGVATGAADGYARMVDKPATLLHLGPGLGNVSLRADGLALAGMVRQRWPALAVLLTSGFAAELDGMANRGSADFELLRKPYRKAALASALRQVLAER